MESICLLFAAKLRNPAFNEINTIDFSTQQPDNKFQWTLIYASHYSYLFTLPRNIRKVSECHIISISLLLVEFTAILRMIDVVLQIKKVLFFKHTLTFQNLLLVHYCFNIHRYLILIHRQIWYNNNYCINLLYCNVLIFVKIQHIQKRRSITVVDCWKNSFVLIFRLYNNCEKF